MTGSKKNKVMKLILSLMAIGALREGDKLPSLRDVMLAEDVSLYTAQSAYDELAFLAVIENKPKSGYYVAPAPPDLDKIIKKYIDDLPQETFYNLGGDLKLFEEYITNMGICGGNAVQLSRDLIHEGFFGTISSDANRETSKHFPVSQRRDYFGAEITKVMTLISKWMVDFDVYLRVDNMCLVSNSLDAITVAIRAAYSPGRILGIEAPSSRYFRFCANLLSLEFREIPNDVCNGFNVDQLEKDIRDGFQYYAVLLQSGYCDPSGSTMPVAEKERLVQICEAHDIMIIEYDSHSRSYTPEQLPLKKYNHSRVVYISDFSSIYGNMLPVSFVEGGILGRAIRTIVNYNSFSTPSVEHIANLSFLLSENINAQIQKIKTSTDTTTALFYRTLNETSGFHLLPINDIKGPYLWLGFTPKENQEHFYSYAVKHQVYVAPGVLFSRATKMHNYVRLNCCSEKQPESVIRNAKQFARVVNRYLSGP